MSSDKCANPYTLWLADTNNDVMKITNEKLQQLLTASPTAYFGAGVKAPTGLCLDISSWIEGKASCDIIAHTVLLYVCDKHIISLRDSS